MHMQMPGKGIERRHFLEETRPRTIAVELEVGVAEIEGRQDIGMVDRRVFARQTPWRGSMPGAVIAGEQGLDAQCEAILAGKIGGSRQPVALALTGGLEAGGLLRRRQAGMNAVSASARS